MDIWTFVYTTLREISHGTYGKSYKPFICSMESVKMTWCDKESRKIPKFLTEIFV